MAYPLNRHVLLAGDISAYYRKQIKNEDTGSELTWSLGAVLSNLGGKVNYGSGTDTESFIPTNLKLGGGLSFTADGRNRFNFILDASKLMVPTLVQHWLPIRQYKITAL